MLSRLRALIAAYATAVLRSASSTRYRSTLPTPLLRAPLGEVAPRSDPPTRPHPGCGIIKMRICHRVANA
eukprot:1600467-Rhodomonas_salina.5